MKGLLLLLVCALALLVAGQDLGDGSSTDIQAFNDETTASFNAADHILTNMPSAHPDVRIGFVLPKNDASRLPAGEEVEILVGIANDSDDYLNITNIAGSVNSPVEYRMHIQNFSVAYLSYEQEPLVIEPHTEITVAYHFKPDAMLDPRDYQIGLTVFYADAGAEETVTRFSTTFFNNTVEIFEAEYELDTRGFFNYLILAALVGALLFGAYKLVLRTCAKSRGGFREYGTRRGNSAEDSQWTDHLEPKKQQKRVTSRSPASHKQK